MMMMMMMMMMMITMMITMMTMIFLWFHFCPLHSGVHPQSILFIDKRFEQESETKATECAMSVANSF